MFGLSFLFPAFLIASAAAAVPIVLHLLKREAAPPVPFSAVRFLKRAPVERSRRKRLRELVLLSLRVLALLLLAFAFARPYFDEGAVAASVGVTVVAVDRSFSLSAPGRFERARALAREAVERVQSGDLVAVLAFDTAADLVAPASTGRAPALAAIDRLAPGPGSTRYRVALARAATEIGPRRGRIVVVTDLQRSGWEGDELGGVPERVAVEVVDLGPADTNLAVLSLDEHGARAVAVVTNHGSSARTSRARLLIGDRQVAEVPFSAEPRRATDVFFDVALPRSGTASITIDDPGGFGADDTRYRILDPPAPVSVLALTARTQGDSDTLYLERALLAAEEAPRFRFTAQSGDALSATGTLDGDPAVVVLMATRGLDRRGRDALAAYLERGGGLLLAVGSAIEPGAVSEILGPAAGPRIGPPGEPGPPVTLSPADLRHPIFRAFGAFAGNLGQVRFTRVAQIMDEPDVPVLARFSNGAPALLEQRRGEGVALLFGSDLSNKENNFPLHPTFVPFVHEAIEYLARSREAPREYVVGEVPSNVSGIRPPGVATVQGGRRVAINVDTRESDPARVSEPEFRAAVTRLNQAASVEARSDARQREEQQGLWRYGLILMLGALVAEGIVGRRMGS